MKKTRKILAVALFLLLMLTPVVSVSQPVTVQAAAKTTLKKSGGRYYAYENGKKLCNAWRKIKSGKVSYTYYFGANGAAYQADKEMMGKYSVIVKKIKGQYYGFDYLGHRVKGVRVGEYLCIWNAICILLQRKRDLQQNKNSTVESCFQNKQKCNNNQENFSENTKNTKISKNSCFRNGNGVDITYTYDNVELSVIPVQRVRAINMML